MVHVIGVVENRLLQLNGASKCSCDDALVSRGAAINCVQLQPVSVSTAWSAVVLVTPGDQVAAWLPVQVTTGRMLCASVDDGATVAARTSIAAATSETYDL